MVTELPDNALTTVAALKDELGASCSAVGVPRLIRAILSATYQIEAALGRELHRATRTEGLISYGRARLMPRVSPIVSITQLTLIDGGELIDSSTYRLTDDGALLRTDGGVWQMWASYQRQISEARLIAGSEDSAYQLTYTAGWVTPIQALRDSELTRDLPHDIEEACLSIATSQVLATGRDVEIASERLMEASVTYRGAGMDSARASLLGELRARYERFI